MGKYILLIGVLGGFAIATIVYSVRVWNGFAGTQMSGNGWTALVLGVIFSFIVGCGLMWLVFYSSRKGYDEHHQRVDDE